MTKRTRPIAVFTAVCLLAAFVLPAVPQAPGYHDFADHRAALGVANFLDVASNLGFLLVALLGLAVVFRAPHAFQQPSERVPYVVFFTGMLLTAFGSAYYHLAPDNERLFWDRLPMTVAFMSLLAAQVADRLSVRAGLALLAPMLLIGAASVWYWLATERAGSGNVIPYGILQGYSVVMLLLITWQHPSRYTRGDDLYWVFAFYLAAKVFEAFDRQVLALGHLVSGHSIKHLAAAFGGLVICRMLMTRRPQPPLAVGATAAVGTGRPRRKPMTAHSLLLTIVLAVAVPGAARAAGAADTAPLEGPEWRLTALRGLDPKALASVAEGVTMRFEGGRLQGFSGCNRLAGSYTLDADRLTIPAAAGTMMACPAPVMRVEDAFRKALTGTFRFAVGDGRLTLTAVDGGEPLLTFVAAPAPRLDGIVWEVTAFNNGRQAVVSPRTGTTLTLAFEGGSVSGSAGCNTFRAPYTTDGGRLTIGPAAATRRHCDGEGVMQQEREFLAALESTTTWAIERDLLDLHRADGERVLWARPKAP